MLFRSQNLLELNDRQMQEIRGNRIGMIFQEPMTSLNPVLTIGKQLCEAIELHQGLTHKQARARAIELLQMVAIPEAMAMCTMTLGSKCK